MSKIHTYEDTLKKVESLILFKIPRDERPKDVRQFNNILAMNNYVKRLDVDISKLNFIHVAGTKGKGSTCTFIESILRAQGYKTGLFTSPHLIDIRERIKIDGKPISKESFIDTFWGTYNGLDKTKNDMFPSMATYFRILTVIAFQIFIQEKVDVAIMEVGLGGRLDATNIITPKVCGITSIGYDHCEILGNTLPEIASEKAGIIKKNIPIVTYNQKKGVEEVFLKKSKELDSPFIKSPNFDEYINAQTEKTRNTIKLQMLGEHQHKNASLALTICDIWKKSEIEPKFEIVKYPTFEISQENIKGLNSCRLEGRGHIVRFKKKNLAFHLDGAHTMESISLCKNWFEQVVKNDLNQKGWVMNINGSGEKCKTIKKTICLHDKKEGLNKLNRTKSSSIVLIFNYTGSRNPEKLLEPFMKMEGFFDYVFFVPLDSSKEILTKTYTVTKKDEKQLSQLVDTWKEGTKNSKENTICDRFNSINDCLSWIWNKDDTSTRVLVTGSLYLVGDFLFKLSLMKKK